MATAPATPMRPRREMQEVKAPELFQFNKQGQTIEGVLLQIEPTPIKDKKTGEIKALEQYMFQQDNGQRISCLETNDLKKKIMPQHIGHYMTVRYATDDSSFVQAGSSPMKVFEVRVSKEKEPGF